LAIRSMDRGGERGAGHAVPPARRRVEYLVAELPKAHPAGRINRG
jgi:hypothetical protein